MFVLHSYGALAQIWYAAGGGGGLNTAKVLLDLLPLNL